MIYAVIVVLLLLLSVVQQWQIQGGPADIASSPRASAGRVLIIDDVKKLPIIEV